MMTSPEQAHRGRPPCRIQRRRTAGWRMPADAVYIGRPSRWGNSVARLDRPITWWIDDSGGKRRIDRVLTRAEAILQYRVWHGEGWDLDGWAAFGAYVAEHLAGKDLACWCPLPDPGEPDLCHGAVLLELANKPPVKDRGPSDA